MVKALILFDGENTEGDRDGDEFDRWAHNAVDCYEESQVYEIHGDSALEKRQEMFNFLRGQPTQYFDRVLFFCHGAPKNLNRKMVSDVNCETFSRLVNERLVRDGAIVFFSCRTAETNDGFARWVADYTGKRVIGHQTRGHTAINPFKVLLDHVGVTYEELWEPEGGVDMLRNYLNSDSDAPFEFIEKVFHS